MKHFQKIIAVCLCTLISVSIMTMSAFALTTSEYTAVKTEVAAFPQLGYLSGDSKHVFALQAYLMRFNDTCRSKLKYGNSYMDGEYGGCTKAAVAYAQSILNVSSDGVCGSKTWAAIANSLVNNGTGVYRRYSTHGNCYVVEGNGGTAQDGFPSLCYLDENNASQMITNPDIPFLRRISQKKN